jgi:hypothetical protein
MSRSQAFQVVCNLDKYISTLPSVTNTSMGDNPTSPPAKHVVIHPKSAKLSVPVAWPRNS